MRENDRHPTPEVRPQPAMTVYCPHCSTGYLLPDQLVGPRGARVRCPNCQGSFVVLPGGSGELTGEPLREATPGDVFENSGRGAAATAGAAGSALMDVEPATVDVSPSAEPPSSVSPLAEQPTAIAAAILDALVATLGDALADARRRGRVLSEHGPAIMDAYAEYCRRAGAGAPPQPFRDALKGRCGIDLMPRRER